MGEFKLTFHDFLDDYESLRRHADGVDYSCTRNPADGVDYPNISTDIPPDVQDEVLSKLASFFGKTPHNVTMFMRLSLTGDRPPHAAHNDVAMGQFTFMLYLTRDQHAKGGTSFVRHADADLSKGVTDADEQKIWERDTNKREYWRRTDTIKMEQNKALVFNSNLMHWAESPYAFGDSASNGRLMLLCFFNL